MRKKDGLSILVLLSLAIGLNVPPTMVLCLGSHGHVAVEPAHDRCADRVRIYEAEAAADHAGFDSCSDTRCCGCTDIPIPSRLCGSRETSKSGIARSTAVLHAALTPEDGAARATVRISPHPSSSYCLPLRSIVLRM